LCHSEKACNKKNYAGLDIKARKSKKEQRCETTVTAEGEAILLELKNNRSINAVAEKVQNWWFIHSRDQKGVGMASYRITYLQKMIN